MYHGLHSLFTLVAVPVDVKKLMQWGDPKWKPPRPFASQKELVTFLDIGKQTLSNWKKRGIAMTAVERIAERFGRSVDEVMGRDRPAHDGYSIAETKTAYRVSHKGWPFKAISPEQIDRLSDFDKGRVEQELLRLLADVSGKPNARTAARRK